MNKAAAAILLACIFLSAVYAAPPVAPQTPGPAVAPPSTAPPGGPQAPKPAAAPSTASPLAPSAGGAAPPNAALPAPQQSKAILNDSGNPLRVGLNEKLLVPVGAQVDASKYVLLFNGQEVKGLPEATYDKSHKSLVFELKRNDKNKDLWTALLGSPNPFQPTRVITVSLGERPTDPKTALQPTFTGTFELEVVPVGRFLIAIFVISGVIWLVFARARKNTALRDGLIPQIEPRLQTYSLGRCQMAFWFVLIFCSFVFLYIITWDYNTISEQAMKLMGISVGTGLAAVAVDVIKDSPADHVNRALQALGFNSYDDIERVKDVEIPGRQKQLAAKTSQRAPLLQKKTAAASGGPALTAQEEQQLAQLNQDVTKLTLENDDWQNRLSTYYAKIRPFLTQGWFKDVTTDLNGPAVHRLQVFSWTGLLGGVFLIGVYRDLAMPEFSGTLLALMGISSAGYVGFKYPEKNI
jgi:hypothetical protein